MIGVSSKRVTFALCCSLVGSAFAAPQGSLGYLQVGSAWVRQNVTGPASVLPGSKGAVLLTLSPTTGEAAYLVGAPGTSLSANRVPPLKGHLAARPYKTARPLPNAFQDLRSLSWSEDGRRLQGVRANGKDFIWEKSRGTLTSQVLASLSRNGKVSAFSDDHGVYFSTPAMVAVDSFFEIPLNLGPLEQALITAGKSLVVRELLFSLKLSLELRDWGISVPAVSPDGKAVYFATNLGQSFGASGNTSFMLFKGDTNTRRITALGHLGMFDGRLPDLLVSPDGQKLLVITSFHGSAVDEPTSAYAVDLAAQRATELVMSESSARSKSNVDAGFCWLADSRHVAFSVAYYDPSDALNKPNFTLRDRDYSLLVKDVATARTVTKIAGATRPSCGAK